MENPWTTIFIVRKEKDPEGDVFCPWTQQLHPSNGSCIDSKLVNYLRRRSLSYKPVSYT